MKMTNPPTSDNPFDLNNLSHVEAIQCPECDATQEAEVLHTMPDYTYEKNCCVCGYAITKPEWKTIGLPIIWASLECKVHQCKANRK
jgi:hypothetical protein